MKAAAGAPENELLERLAALEHDQWIAWSKAIAHVAKISEERAIRWALLWVPYRQLKEEDKEKDREWARKVLALIDADSKLRAQRDKRLKSKILGADGWLEWAEKETKSPSILRAIRQARTELSNTQTEPEDSKSQ